MPDLVILDIMMPGMDGFEVCRRLRAQSQVPIIFLSAKDEEFDKVLGFTLGADDYVTKPFKPRELVVRVKARLRPRIQEAAAPDAGRLTPPILELAGIQLDGSGHRAFLHGEELALTPKEFDCLACLLGARAFRARVGGGVLSVFQQYRDGPHPSSASQARRNRFDPRIHRDGVGRRLSNPRWRR